MISILASCTQWSKENSDNVLDFIAHTKIIASVFVAIFCLESASLIRKPPKASLYYMHFEKKITILDFPLICM